MADDVINLNIGGTSYSTTRQTLLREQDTLLAKISRDEEGLPESVIKLDEKSYFVDRDGPLFSLILNFLRTDKLLLPDGFKEMARLKDESDFYQLDKLSEQLTFLLPMNGNGNNGSLRPKYSTTNGGATYLNGENGERYGSGGYITIGYRGTFAFGRDGQADVKFRKLHRILVCGRATLCREVFGDTLNESRDPGGPDDGERYTSRLYLKHQCLERACDTMAGKGFKLVATCCSGANGLAAANHPVLSGQMGPTSQSDLMNHRNCGDFEEQRWAHYTEYIFYREPLTSTITPVPSPRLDM